MVTQTRLSVTLYFHCQSYSTFVQTNARIGPTAVSFRMPCNSFTPLILVSLEGIMVLRHLTLFNIRIHAFQKG